MCERDPIGSNYAYSILPGMAVSNDVGLAQAIRQQVQQAWQEEGKQGLILLTGCRGGVGLDVKEVSTGWGTLLEPGCTCQHTNAGQGA